MGQAVWLRKAFVWGGVALTLAVAALGLISAARRIAAFQPVGFDAQRAGSAWAVTAVTVPTVGLETGDLVVFVDGAEPVDRADLDRRLRREAESELLVLRSDEPATVRYLRPPLEIDWAYLLLVLSGTAALAVGLYTVGRVPSQAEARLFFVWSLATGAVYLISHPPDLPFDHVARIAYLTEELARLVLAPLTLHLFLVFPAGPQRRRPWVPLLYAPAAALAVLQLDLLLGSEWLLAATRSSLERLDTLGLLHLVLGGATAVLVLWRRSRTFVAAEPRRQALWIALGLAVGYIPFLLLEIGPRLAGWSSPPLVEALAVLPLSLVPVAFAWAILRYRLWDLGLVVRDSVATAVTLVVGGSAFALLQLAIDRHLPTALSDSRPLLSAMAGLVTAGLLVPTQRGVRRRLERVIHLDRLEDRQALTELGRALLAEHDPEQLEQRLVTALRDGLGVDDIVLLLARDGHLEDRSGRLRVELQGIEELWRRPLIAIGPGVPGDPARALHAMLYEAALRYLIPLEARGERIGMLALGYRQGEFPLSSEDLDIVASLAAPTALALENAHLVSALERRLEQVEQLTRRSDSILASSPAGIALLDAAGLVQHANRTFRTVVGMQAVGHPIAEVLPVALPPAGAGPQRLAFRDPAGHERHLEVARARGEFDGAIQDIVVVQDVGDRIELERQLHEQERLAALGMLAAGVAHEVNTPLTGISSYAQMLLAQTPAEDERHPLLLKVERQTFRAARIVRDLLELARDRSDGIEPIDVAQALRQTIDAVAHRAGEAGVAIEAQLDHSARVSAAAVEVEQIFTNLCLNAIEAMPSGGTLELTIETTAQLVVVHVRDTGEGIAPEDLDKIFRPFFSTKHGRGGTGLGLAITRQFLERIGGDIRVSSERGRGTTFEVVLPRLPEEPTH